MLLGIDPKVDFAFKWVFGNARNEALLVHLLNAILLLKSPMLRAQVLNPFNEKEFETDKLSVLDLKVEDQLGRRFNIEIQLLIVPFFRERILYYWANMLREQIREGDDYGTLKPVISICLVNQVMFPDVDDYHSIFNLMDARTGACFSEHIQVHVIEFPKFQQPVDTLVDAVEKWVYLLRNAAELNPDDVPTVLNEPIYQQAIQEWEMLTKDDIERERYASRMKAIMDQRTWEATIERQQAALLEAQAQALESEEKGLKKGRQEGALMGKILLLQTLLGVPQSEESELEEWPLERLTQVEAELQTRLREREKS